MRNGNIALGAFILFMSGSVVGRINYDESFWLIVAIWVLALSANWFAFGRIDNGLNDELAKAELKRKAQGR